MKIERKISFTVAGYEFDNLKTAQFFKRALTLHLQDLDPIDGIYEEHEAQMLLNSWDVFSDTLTKTDIVNRVMALQLPKPARKKKEIKNGMTHAEARGFIHSGIKKNAQVLAGDECLPGPVVLDMDEAETKFEMIPDSDIYSNPLN